MRDYIDVTGKNEDEAISKALAQLGLDRDDVSVEVLERAKSGFLGLGACPAKIRVYYGPEEEAPAPEPAPAPKPEPVQARPRSAAPEKKERPERRERPRQEGRLQAGDEVLIGSAPTPREPVSVEPASPGDEKAGRIRAFLTGLMEHMKVQAVPEVFITSEGNYKVILQGKDLGAIIGRRGETLDAIQQLTSYSVNRAGGGPRPQGGFNRAPARPAPAAPAAPAAPKEGGSN